MKKKTKTKKELVAELAAAEKVAQKAKEKAQKLAAQRSAEQVGRLSQKAKLLRQQRKKRKMIFFMVLFVVGINMIVIGALYNLYRQTILSFQAVPVTTFSLNQRTPIPIRVQIPSQKIDLPITEAAIHNGVWDTSQTSATHLDSSARPAEQGNIVIYGHNLVRLFGKIRGMKKGDAISVISQDGTVHHYVVDLTETVKPDDIQVVLPTSREELTLYTCTGFLDTLRFIVKAKPTL